jgi:hypothetical protein
MDSCNAAANACEHTLTPAVHGLPSSHTADACDPVAGCLSTPVADATPCDRGGLPGTCQAGSCVP